MVGVEQDHSPAGCRGSWARSASRILRPSSSTCFMKSLPVKIPTTRCQSSLLDLGPRSRARSRASTRRARASRVTSITALPRGLDVQRRRPILTLHRKRCDLWSNPPMSFASTWSGWSRWCGASLAPGTRSSSSSTPRGHRGVPARACGAQSGDADPEGARSSHRGLIQRLRGATTASYPAVPAPWAEVLRTHAQNSCTRVVSSTTLRRRRKRLSTSEVNWGNARLRATST